MRSRVERSHVVAFTVIALGVAGCSSGTTRFEEDPFANPYASRPESRRSDVAAQPAPSSRIESQPLPQVQSYQALPPPPSRQTAYAPVESRAGSPGMASYNSNPEITGGVRSDVPATRSNWSWDGGTAVVVRPGETLDGLSRKYGVPAAAIIKANGFAPRVVLYPGQQVVIPRYSYASVVSAGHPPASKPSRMVFGGAGKPHGVRRFAPSNIHVVQQNETLISIAKHHGTSVAEIAAANHISLYERVKVGERLTIPGTRMAQAPRQVPVQPRPAVPPRLANNEPPPSARTLSPPDAHRDEEAEATGSAERLRWPAIGRVISHFHERLENGQLNDGINIAMPEGTPIHAAADGVVAYAGNELKGYGNLILIRHPTGFVTAYAHTSDILVKRNEEIRRGQVIAHAGETGAVNSPQLHFETRKGSVPVDPGQYLPKGG
jgi:murein DD-endopeptidase MepM/ murein hydrolase activator NlpD